MTGPGRREWIAGLAKLCLRREEYPEVVVVELAAASWGELRAITRPITPDIAVVTNVCGTHLEYFRTIDAVARRRAGWFEGCDLAASRSSMPMTRG